VAAHFRPAVLGVLAAQFFEVSETLSSWLEPVLRVLK
jgi:hypothetical protein